MIEIESRDGHLIFKDYLGREIIIAEEDYLALIANPKAQEIRPNLEDCLKTPTEVWWMVEDIDGKSYSYYKYLKIYRDLVFVAYVLHDATMNFSLNNFYAYDEQNFAGAENERRGQLVKG